jgi:hypothetical protein
MATALFVNIAIYFAWKLRFRLVVPVVSFPQATSGQCGVTSAVWTFDTLTFRSEQLTGPSQFSGIDAQTDNLHAVD